MKIDSIRDDLGEKGYSVFFRANGHLDKFLPSQQKAIKAGLLDGRNLLICTPTASGKTLIAEMAGVNTIANNGKKVLYIVPLKALASEKYKELGEKYKESFKVGVSSGDLDSADEYLKDRDFIITTAEKCDSLLRHNVPWIHDVGLLVVDEIHLLNDPGRGPTLEILIVLIRKILSKLQMLGLSATVGNADELAEWLDADLVQDDWRPVKLEKGIYIEDRIEFYEK